MMKFLAVLLSLYILLLTAIPCADVAPGNSLCKSEITKSTANHNHQHPDIDHCSPFCTCNCCASPVLQIDTVVDFICIKFSTYTYPEYSSAITSWFTPSIWQPPKLS